MTRAPYTEPRSPGWGASPEAWTLYLTACLDWVFDGAAIRRVNYAGLATDLLGRHRVAHSTIRQWVQRRWVETVVLERTAAALALTDTGRAAISHRGYVAGVGDLYGAGQEVRDVE